MARVLHIFLLAAAAASISFAAFDLKLSGCTDEKCGCDKEPTASYPVTDKCTKMEGEDFHYKASCNNTTWSLYKYNNEKCSGLVANVQYLPKDTCFRYRGGVNRKGTILNVYFTEECSAGGPVANMSEAENNTCTKIAAEGDESASYYYKVVFKGDDKVNGEVTIYDATDSMCKGLVLHGPKVVTAACEPFSLHSIKGQCVYKPDPPSTAPATPSGCSAVTMFAATVAMLLTGFVVM